VQLIDTYRRLVETCPNLHVQLVGEAPVGNWVRVADVAGCAEALDAAIEGAAARILAKHGRPARPDVAASRLLHHYLWSTELLISGPWYLMGSIASVTPDQLWTDPASGDFALLTRLSVVDGADPAAVRDAVERCVRPLLDAFGPRVRRGPHALWGMAGDDLVAGIWYLGRMLGEEERAVRRAEELFSGTDGLGRFPYRADFRTLHGADRDYVTRTRTGCCLNYTLKAGKPCLTCPRLTDDERLRRLETPAG